MLLKANKNSHKYDCVGGKGFQLITRPSLTTEEIVLNSHRAGIHAMIASVSLFDEPASISLYDDPASVSLFNESACIKPNAPNQCVTPTYMYIHVE